jgi:hypothetical protein
LESVKAVSRFEHVRKICRRWRQRYKRKGFGRVLGKQGGDRRSENRSSKKLWGGEMN